MGEARSKACSSACLADISSARSVPDEIETGASCPREVQRRIVDFCETSETLVFKGTLPCTFKLADVFIETRPACEGAGNELGRIHWARAVISAALHPQVLSEAGSDGTAIFGTDSATNPRTDFPCSSFDRGVPSACGRHLRPPAPHHHATMTQAAANFQGVAPGSFSRFS